jgi:hypothetical protein
LSEELARSYLTLIIRLLVHLGSQSFWSYGPLIYAVLPPQEPVLQRELSNGKCYYDVFPWDPGLIDRCSEPLLSALVRVLLERVGWTNREKILNHFVLYQRMVLWLLLLLPCGFDDWEGCEGGDVACTSNDGPWQGFAVSTRRVNLFHLNTAYIVQVCIGTDQ